MVYFIFRGDLFRSDMLRRPRWTTPLVCYSFMEVLQQTGDSWIYEVSLHEVYFSSGIRSVNFIWGHIVCRTWWKLVYWNHRRLMWRGVIYSVFCSWRIVDFRDCSLLKKLSFVRTTKIQSSYFESKLYILQPLTKTM